MLVSEGVCLNTLKVYVDINGMFEMDMLFIRHIRVSTSELTLLRVFKQNCLTSMSINHSIRIQTLCK